MFYAYKTKLDIDVGYPSVINNGILICFGNHIPTDTNNWNTVDVLYPISYTIPPRVISQRYTNNIITNDYTNTGNTDTRTINHATLINKITNSSFNVSNRYPHFWVAIGY